MAHYDLEEQEQIDSIKTWWKMYGNLVTGVILAGSLAVIGWQGWNWYQRSQSAQASAIYGVLEQAVAARDAQRVKAAAGELAEKFGGTSYAALGALIAARQSFDAGDLKTAKAQLSWAADKGKDEIKDLARLRLASVLLDEKAYDEALKQLESAHAAAFAARFLELKGDVLAAQGNKPEARIAYKAALEKGEAR
ncbi:MAG: tetratricopeptide repeat protein, partial [Azonexus sp.]